jgi:hypothetical protein
MATATKFNQFTEDLCKGVHNFTSDATCTVTVALCATGNAPVATNSVLADLTQIAYTNLSSRVVTGITAEQSGGTARMTATDLVLTATGTVASFRYIVLYNDDPTSPADPLICFYSTGATAVTLNNGDTYTIDFSTYIVTLA